MTNKVSGSSPLSNHQFPPSAQPAPELQRLANSVTAASSSAQLQRPPIVRRFGERIATLVQPRPPLPSNPTAAEDSDLEEGEIPEDRYQPRGAAAAVVSATRLDEISKLKRDLQVIVDRLRVSAEKVKKMDLDLPLDSSLSSEIANAKTSCLEQLLALKGQITTYQQERQVMIHVIDFAKAYNGITKWQNQMGIASQSFSKKCPELMYILEGAKSDPHTHTEAVALRTEEFYNDFSVVVTKIGFQIRQIMNPKTEADPEVELGLRDEIGEEFDQLFEMIIETIKDPKSFQLLTVFGSNFNWIQKWAKQSHIQAKSFTEQYKNLVANIKLRLTDQQFDLFYELIGEPKPAAPVLTPPPAAVRTQAPAPLLAIYPHEVRNREPALAPPPAAARVQTPAPVRQASQPAATSPERLKLELTSIVSKMEALEFRTKNSSEDPLELRRKLVKPKGGLKNDFAAIQDELKKSIANPEIFSLFMRFLIAFDSVSEWQSNTRLSGPATLNFENTFSTFIREIKPLLSDAQKATLEEHLENSSELCGFLKQINAKMEILKEKSETEPVGQKKGKLLDSLIEKETLIVEKIQVPLVFDLLKSIKDHCAVIERGQTHHSVVRTFNFICTKLFEKIKGKISEEHYLQLTQSPHISPEIEDAPVIEEPTVEPRLPAQPEKSKFKNVSFLRKSPLEALETKLSQARDDLESLKSDHEKGEVSDKFKEGITSEWAKFLNGNAKNISKHIRNESIYTLVKQITTHFSGKMDLIKEFVETLRPKMSAQQAKIFPAPNRPLVQDSQPAYSSSSSSVPTPKPSQGVNPQFPFIIRGIVNDIEILVRTLRENPNIVSEKGADWLADKKRGLVQRLTNYKKDLMKSIGQPEFFNLFKKYFVSFEEITLRQLEKSVLGVGGQAAKPFRKTFSGWIEEILPKLNEDQKAQLKGLEEKQSPALEKLKKDLEKIKEDLLSAFTVVKSGRQERKYLNTRKDRFLKRLNKLESSIQRYWHRNEIQNLVKEIKATVREISEWQSSKLSNGVNGNDKSARVKGFNQLCPNIDQLIGVVPEPRPNTLMANRIQGAAIELEKFKAENAEWFERDKKYLAKKSKQKKVDELKTTARVKKQTTLQSFALGKYFKSGKSLNPAREAAAAERLAQIYNEFGDFQAKCPRAKHIRYFYEIFEDYAESLRGHLSDDSAVFAKLPERNNQKEVEASESEDTVVNLPPRTRSAPAPIPRPVEVAVPSSSSSSSSSSSGISPLPQRLKAVVNDVMQLNNANWDEIAVPQEKEKLLNQFLSLDIAQHVQDDAIFKWMKEFIRIFDRIQPDPENRQTFKDASKPFLANLLPKLTDDQKKSLSQVVKINVPIDPIQSLATDLSKIRDSIQALCNRIEETHLQEGIHDKAKLKEIHDEKERVSNQFKELMTGKGALCSDPKIFSIMRAFAIDYNFISTNLKDLGSTAPEPYFYDAFHQIIESGELSKEQKRDRAIFIKTRPTQASTSENASPVPAPTQRPQKRPVTIGESSDESSEASEEDTPPPALLVAQQARKQPRKTSILAQQASKQPRKSLSIKATKSTLVGAKRSRTEAPAPIRADIDGESSDSSSSRDSFVDAPIKEMSSTYPSSPIENSEPTYLRRPFMQEPDSEDSLEENPTKRARVASTAPKTTSRPAAKAAARPKKRPAPAPQGGNPAKKARVAASAPQTNRRPASTVPAQPQMRPAPAPLEQNPVQRAQSAAPVVSSSSFSSSSMVAAPTQKKPAKVTLNKRASKALESIQKPGGVKREIQARANGLEKFLRPEGLEKYKDSAKLRTACTQAKTGVTSIFGAIFAILSDQQIQENAADLLRLAVAFNKIGEKQLELGAQSTAYFFDLYPEIAHKVANYLFPNGGRETCPILNVSPNSTGIKKNVPRGNRSAAAVTVLPAAAPLPIPAAVPNNPLSPAPLQRQITGDSFYRHLMSPPRAQEFPSLGEQQTSGWSFSGLLDSQEMTQPDANALSMVRPDEFLASSPLQNGPPSTPQPSSEAPKGSEEI